MQTAFTSRVLGDIRYSPPLAALLPRCQVCQAIAARALLIM
jgi:hypothetical protein